MWIVNNHWKTWVNASLKWRPTLTDDIILYENFWVMTKPTNKTITIFLHCMHCTAQCTQLRSHKWWRDREKASTSAMESNKFAFHECSLSIAHHWNARNIDDCSILNERKSLCAIFFCGYRCCGRCCYCCCSTKNDSQYFFFSTQQFPFGLLIPLLN